MAKSLISAVAVAGSALGVAAHSAGDVTSFTLTGGCDQLANAKFSRVGFTQSGAPYYKAEEAEMYMYWDADCAGSTDGTPRWIIDDNKPNTEVPHDLDQDGSCGYIARINNIDKILPPTQGMWTIECAGVSKEMRLMLDMPTSTTTRTATTAARTTTTADPHAAHGTTLHGTHGAASGYVFEGACEEKGFLNGATFEEAGHTKDGTPYYKAKTMEAYVYLDKDCDGPEGSVAVTRWIIDDSKPSTTADHDLDGDGKCQYHARLTSASQSLPMSSTWKMFCGADGWMDLELSFKNVADEHGHGATTTTERPKMVSFASVGRPAIAVLLAAIGTWQML